jgi:hypothetical protein
MARAKRRNHNTDDENELESGSEIEGVEDIEHAAHETAGAARRQFRRLQQSAFDPVDLFGGPVARLMDQNLSMFQKMMHAMREESMHFVNRRLEHTSQAIESSRECDGISDLLAIQQGWMVDFARDYAEQTKRFAELMRDLAEDGASNLSHATSEIADRGRNSVEEETHRATA